MSQFDSPTPPEFDTTGEPPAWPKVIGIISICWGSLGLFCNVCSLAGTFASGSLVNMMPPEQQEQMRQQMAAQQSPAMMGLIALSIIFSGVLIAAGIMTLKRKPLGRTLHLGYGAIGLLLAIGGAVVSWGIVQSQMAAASGSTQPPGQQAGMVVGMVFGVCFGLAYPLFSLIWFGVMGKRPEVGAKDLEPVI